MRADTLALSSGPKAVIGREGKMHNQHAGLTGVLAEQRMTEHQQQARYDLKLWIGSLHESATYPPA